MADNFNLRQYLVENKLGPFAKAKSINEASGIEGVVNQDMLRKFLIAASNIVEDLEPEGFDEEDVIIYLEKQLDSLSLSMLRANIPARKRTDFGSQFRSPLQEDEESGDSFEAEAEMLGGQIVKRMDERGKVYSRYALFKVNGQPQNIGRGTVKYELSVDRTPAQGSSKLKAREVGGLSNLDQNIENVKTNGRVEVHTKTGSENVTVPTEIMNFIKKYV